ncbi:hypothetical protein GCM10009562_41510 [Nocardioides aquaticus]
MVDGRILSQLSETRARLLPPQDGLDPGALPSGERDYPSHLHQDGGPPTLPQTADRMGVREADLV